MKRGVTRYYLDGYNLLFRLTNHPDSFEDAREELILRLKPISSRLNLIVVFDAPDQKEPYTRTHIDHLEIVYTGGGQSADQFILAELDRIDRAVVITSDKTLSRQARDLGATTQPMETFFELLLPEETAPADARFPPADFDRWLAIFQKMLEE